MSKAVIVSACRTAVGTMGGALTNVSATDLGGLAVKEAVSRARIEGSELLDYNDAEKYMSLPKDRKIVFSCHTGVRSLDVAAYFVGHGFTQVHSMRGGIDAWSDQVDPSVPKY